MNCTAGKDHVDLISRSFRSNWQPEGLKPSWCDSRGARVVNSSVPCRGFRGLLDSRPGDSLTGRAAGQRKPRQHLREVLPGDSRVQLPGQPHHLHPARRGDARDVQVDPVLPVWREGAEGSLAAPLPPSSSNASGASALRSCSEDLSIVGEPVLFCQQETVDFVPKSEEHAAKSDDNDNSWV